MSKKNLFAIVENHKHHFAFEHIGSHEKEVEELEYNGISTEGFVGDLFGEIVDVFQESFKLGKYKNTKRTPKSTAKEVEEIDLSKFKPLIANNKLKENIQLKESVSIPAIYSKELMASNGTDLASIAKNAEQTLAIYKKDAQVIKSKLPAFYRALEAFNRDTDKILDDDDTNFSALEKVIKKHMAKSDLDIKLSEVFGKDKGKNLPIGMITTTYAEQIENGLTKVDHGGNAKAISLTINRDLVNKLIPIMFELSELSNNLYDEYVVYKPYGIDLTDPPFRMFSDEIDALDDKTRNKLYSLYVDTVTEHNTGYPDVISSRTYFLARALGYILSVSIKL